MTKQEGATEVCKRCDGDGDGEAHGSDRPWQWSGPWSYPGVCPVCHGTGMVPPNDTKEDAG